MSPSGLHINKPVVFIIFGLIGGFVVWYKFFSGTKEPVLNVDNVPATHDQDSPSVNSAPETLLYQNKTIQGFDVFYISVEPAKSKLDVLFLHGQKFTAETWIKDPPKTLQFLRDQGYRAVAVDLPFARGKADTDVDPVKFLSAVIEGLKLEKPVIVSPSRSGEYSLPFLFNDPGTAKDHAQGFVAVAPVGSDKYVEKYKDASIPSLVIVGSKDDMGEKVKTSFKSLPEKMVTIATLEEAKHACYLDKADEFNQKLLEFLTKLT